MRLSNFNRISLLIGFAFLYLPILLLILFSFNESKLVTVWAGFSTKWYVSLFSNQGILDAAKVSLLVGLAASTIATALGVMAGAGSQLSVAVAVPMAPE